MATAPDDRAHGRAPEATAEEFEPEIVAFCCTF